jgi:hypothetical protein
MEAAELGHIERTRLSKLLSAIWSAELTGDGEWGRWHRLLCGNGRQDTSLRTPNAESSGRQ